MSVVNPVDIRRYKLFNQTIFKIVSTKYYNCVILFKIFKITRYNYKRLSWNKLVRGLNPHKKFLLYIDHFLGGGTAIYSSKKIQDLAQEYNVIVCQYDSFLKKYIFSNDKTNTCVVANSIPDYIFGTFHKIIINNLVGYKNPLGILKQITDAKQKYSGLTVDVMIHDYYPVCPTTHLLKPDLTTCVVRDNIVCTKCQKNIEQWRNIWGNFLTNIPDHIIAFSTSSKQIIQSVYPNLDYKITVIPHEISYIRPVKIKKHDGINIAIVGSLYSIKGQELVCEMLNILPKNVKIIHIGSFFGTPPKNPQFIYAGPYDLKSLPDIVEKYQPDIAFISSVVPETFSFTTAECMGMGLPVACFDIGAPAERVSQYKHGLVISKIDAKTALTEILDFVKQTMGDGNEHTKHKVFE